MPPIFSSLRAAAKSLSSDVVEMWSMDFTELYLRDAHPMALADGGHTRYNGTGIRTFLRVP
ncbi:MAG: hypothetical protein E6Q97_35180 [Desulfurellales bacterium]|nr:MAG: hypothetical protein E6Q97_35180 [Desulfurellales bacterium]